MIRRLPTLVLAAVLLAACATTPPAPPPVEPVTEPTVIGAAGEAVAEGSAAAARGAEIGRRVGTVAGVIAAVFGGPQHESLDDALDRFWMTRDAAEAIGAVIGAAKGAGDGAKRGYEFDVQFAELQKIEGIEAVRPSPEQIQVHLASMPGDATLDALAAVFAGRTGRLIDIEAAGDEALDLREALIARGVPAATISVQRVTGARGITLKIQPV